jgi:DNA-binding response OmpR family regulator
VYTLTRTGEFQLDVLLLTDAGDFVSVLPALEVFAQEVRYAPLRGYVVERNEGAEVAIIDARSDPAAARNACRRLTAIAPTVAVIAVVEAADFVAVDVDWHFDDVLVATASAAELHARLRLAIARRRSVLEGTLKFGDLVLHPASYTAEMGDRELELTLTEFKLLNYLVQHAGQAFTRTRLMHEVWGHETNRRGRTVDVHVQRLRAKLGTEHESLVDTVRGVGYMAVSPPRPRWIIGEPVTRPLRASQDPPIEASVN